MVGWNIVYSMLDGKKDRQYHKWGAHVGQEE